MSGQPVADFAGLLRQLRVQAGLTQEELAEAAGLSPRAVSDLERGIHRTARKDTAVLLAGALGVAGPARELFVAAARGRAPAAEVLAARSSRPGAGGVVGQDGEMAESPYRGLKPFGEQDAGWFFGREAATTTVVDRMARLLAGAGVLVVSGASGAGKSSLLRAGVLPRIRAAGLAGTPGAAWWPRVVFTPTRAPLDELALQVAALAGADAAGVRRELAAHPEGFALTARQAAFATLAGDLAAPGQREQPTPPQRRLVLVVDQFEELFTQCADEDQRQAFITALHAATGHAPAALVVLGVRADFEARCADYPQLVGAVQDRYLVTAMTERQLRMAITEPAKKADLRVDADLVEALLAEMRAERGVFGAGALPLLSYALDQAWRNRTGATLTLADYERTGGIEGAVASSAQRVYDQLTVGQQAAARQVFTRLVTTTSDGTDTTDRANRAELTAGKKPAQAQDMEVVLEAFAAERLLTLAAGTVEISHEALLTAWPLLQDTWLAESRTDRIICTRLRNVAAEWVAHSRDPSYLYGGSLLEAAVSAAARNNGEPGHASPLVQADREFLDASSRAHRRSARRRQAFLILLMALVGLASATIVAVRSSQQATHERDVAVSAGLISESENLGRARRQLSAQLSIAAWDVNHSSAARYGMLAAAARYQIDVHTWPMSMADSVAFSPDSKTLASVSADGIRLWNVATGHLIHSRLGRQGGKVLSVAFSPDGKTLASGSADGTIQLWNLPELAMNGSLPDNNFGPVSSVAFSPDRGTLAGAGPRGIRLWNVAITRPGLRGASNLGPIFSVAFSHNSETVAGGGADGTIQLWDVVTGRPIVKLTSQSDGVLSVAFSPNGDTLASGSAGGVQLWNVASGQKTGFLPTGQDGGVVSVAFSPNGETLASASADGIIRLWDLPTHHQIGGPLGSHGDRVLSVAFSRDGKTLASADAIKFRFWKVAFLIDPVEYLCQWVKELTPSEWRRYLPEGPAYQETCPSKAFLPRALHPSAAVAQQFPKF